MIIRNTPHRWGVIAQLLHWTIVVLIIVQFTLAALAADLPPLKKLGMLARHKSVGITILALAILRLAWRWLNPTPPLPETLKPYQRLLARGTHALMYMLLFAQPLSGWMMSSARGFPVSWFGFFQLPDLVPKNRALYEALLTTHGTLAVLLGAVVTLHAAAALAHHFMFKDDVLRRMLPFTTTRALLAPWLTATAAAVCLAGWAPGTAAEAPSSVHYVLDQAKSTLEFTFMQAGAQNKGRFTRFPVSFDFAPGALAGSRLEVTVEIGSLDSGDKERDDTLRGTDLFAVEKFPQAHFSASQFVRTASGFEALGKLTLRGVTRDARVPFTFRTADEHGVAVGYMSGKTSIRRLDFGVGQGDWRATDQVGNDVGVAFALRLTSAP
jgi:cytochrome b561